MKVKTNNVPRDILSDDQGRLFFNYKKTLWSLNEFLSFHNPVHCPGGPPEGLEGWNGICMNGTGLVVRVVGDHLDQVIVGVVTK
jgi:hypothetical protein